MLGAHLITHAVNVFRVSPLPTPVIVFVPEENMLTLIFNVSHVSITVLYAPVKLTVLSVPVDSSSKMENVSPDATSDTIFQELFVKSVKMAALTVKEPELASFVKPEDTLSMDCVMSTAQ